MTAKGNELVRKIVEHARQQMARVDGIEKVTSEDLISRSYWRGRESAALEILAFEQREAGDATFG